MPRQGHRIACARFRANSRTVNRELKFCVVIPCFNEEESIPVLVEKLVPHLETATQGSWRILFVDDGSRDTTARLIWELNQRDARFQGVRLSRNFGHQPAVWTGLQ